MNDTEARTRVWALIAAALDGRPDDVGPLLDDLERADLAAVVHGLAALASRVVAPHASTDRRSRLVREQLLKLATEEGPDCDRP